MGEMIEVKSAAFCQRCHNKTPAAVDANVEDVRAMLLQRSEVGLRKYGVTTEGANLTLRQWLQHALEEALDKAVYLRAAIRKLDEGTGENDND